MPTLNASYWRDNNHVPLTTDGIISIDTQSLTGNNTTVAVPIFSITGSIEVRGIWGVVTTVLGSNVTAASWRVNDGSAQSAITAATGTTLSALPVGSLIVKKGSLSTALTALTSSSAILSEPTSAESIFFAPFLAVQKTGGVSTNIEFRYITTDTPTSGTIAFYLRWLPITVDATVSPL